MTARMLGAASALLICGVTFCGCYDNAELNDRAYVNALSIDKNEEEKGGRLTAGVAVSDISEHGSSEGSGESEGKSKSFKKSAGNTLPTAIQKTSANSSQKLFFGQTRAVFFGQGLLSDKELFKEAVDGLERNKELSRKTLVLAADKDAAEICGLAPPGEPSIGVFAEKFYNKGFSGSSMAATFKMNLEELMIKLRSNANAIIPKATENNGELHIGGAAVIGGLKLRGYLDEQETRGYLWQHGKIKGANVDVMYKGIDVPYNIISHNTDIFFYETENGLNMSVNIKTTGAVTEYIFGSALDNTETLNEIEALAAEAIEKEAKSANNKLQKQLKCDGADILSILRNKDYKLWVKYKEDWQATFEALPVNVSAAARIKSIGSIK